MKKNKKFFHEGKMGKYRDGQRKRFSVKNGKNVSRRKFTVTYFYRGKSAKDENAFFRRKYEYKRGGR